MCEVNEIKHEFNYSSAMKIIWRKKILLMAFFLSGFIFSILINTLEDKPKISKPDSVRLIMKFDVKDIVLHYQLTTNMNSLNALIDSNNSKGDHSNDYYLRRVECSTRDCLMLVFDKSPSFEVSPEMALKEFKKIIELYDQKILDLVTKYSRFSAKVISQEVKMVKFIDEVIENNDLKTKEIDFRFYLKDILQNISNSNLESSSYYLGMLTESLPESERNHIIEDYYKMLFQLVESKIQRQYLLENTGIMKNFSKYLSSVNLEGAFVSSYEQTSKPLLTQQHPYVLAIVIGCCTFMIGILYTFISEYYSLNRKSHHGALQDVKPS